MKGGLTLLGINYKRKLLGISSIKFGLLGINNIIDDLTWNKLYKRLSCIRNNFTLKITLLEMILIEIKSVKLTNMIISKHLTPASAIIAAELNKVHSCISKV